MYVRVCASLKVVRWTAVSDWTALCGSRVCASLKVVRWTAVSGWTALCWSCVCASLKVVRWIAVSDWTALCGLSYVPLLLCIVFVPFSELIFSFK